MVTDTTANWLAGREERTTNNRMEILAVIKGLEHIPAASPVTVRSDSQYVVNTMTKGWQRKANGDLWQRLDGLVKGRSVKWEWVLGHAGDLFNEEANRLAQAATADANWGEQSGVWGKEEPTTALAPPPEPQQQLTHLDAEGRAHMVDVSDKAVTEREAIAKGTIYMSVPTLALIQSGGVGKGDVFTVGAGGRSDGGQAHQRSYPAYASAALTHIDLAFTPDAAHSCVEITATVRTAAQTGVEMEALAAVSAAALTVYDMCKAVDRAMRISDIRVVRKAGGKSGVFEQP